MLLKGMMSGKDSQIAAVVSVIQTVRPDILLLTDFDHDHAGLALGEFQNLLNEGGNGITYPYRYASAGNAGRPSGLDLDGNGTKGDWDDAVGFGRFPGNGAMALLSRFPFGAQDARSFDRLAWRGRALASKSFWDVPVALPDGRVLHILATHTTPPVFDGAEDRNGLRNAAELAFWAQYLDGQTLADDTGGAAPLTAQHLVLLGDFNNDPQDGEGHKPPLFALLNHPRLQEPAPVSAGNGQNTVDWGPKIGKMRVDYVLPASTLDLTGTGIYWPPPDTDAGETAKVASHHHLVWVDILLGE